MYTDTSRVPIKLLRVYEWLHYPVENVIPLMSCTITLVISPETCYTNYFAKELLTKCVKKYLSHYGEECVGYNVRGLIHVCDFVLTRGALGSFSAF